MTCNSARIRLKVPTSFGVIAILFGTPLLGQSKPPEDGSSKTASLPKIYYVSRPVEQTLPDQRNQKPGPPPPAPTVPPPTPPPPLRPDIAQSIDTHDYTRIAKPKSVARWSRRILDNMPPQAIRERLEGTVHFAVAVSENGRVADCIITQSSGHSILDEALCRGMRRFARFDSALDKLGNPIPGTFSARFTYKVPPRPPKPKPELPQDLSRGLTPKEPTNWVKRIQDSMPSEAVRLGLSGTVGLRVRVGTKGRITACGVDKSSGHSTLDLGACKGMLRYSRFNPALDKQGKPTVGSYYLAITYKNRQPELATVSQQ